MSFEGDVKSFFANVRVAAQEAAVDMAMVALKEIVKESPQFSGQFVANWQLAPYAPSQIAYNDPLNFYQNEAQSELSGSDVTPYKKGDVKAINFAMTKARAGAARARSAPLGTPIFLSNSSQHEEPYAWKIENGEINFRPENPDASRVVQRSAVVVRNRFNKIGPTQLAVLRKIGV